MEQAYRPEAWHDLYVMLGGAAAALAGLLFVAISIHLNEISKIPYLRIFARNNMMAMVAAIIVAAVVLVPQQKVLLGAELFLINLWGTWMSSLVLLRHSRGAPRGRKLRAAGVGFSNVMGMAGAIGLVMEIGGGMYLVTIAHLIFVCLVVSSSWALIMGVYQAEHRSA
jgi:modulator of FtsH protease